MKKQDDDKMWNEIFKNEEANHRRLHKALEQSMKKGSFLSIYDDRLVIDARNGGQWTIDRETGAAKWRSPAVRHPAVQTDMFKR